MSKKKLNKKGQQARAKAQQAKTAPRINPTKEIYDVDAKVQAYSTSECAEEAQVDLGVITEGTEKVDPVTDEVIDVVGTPVVETEEVEEDVDDTETVEEDDESIDENLDEDGLDDYIDDEEDDDEEDVAPTKNRNHVCRQTFSKVCEIASVIDMANKNPDIVDISNYDSNIITAVHIAKSKVDAAIHARSHVKIFGVDKEFFRTEFVNWDDTGYENASIIMDALAKQYNDFIRNQARILNDTNVPNIYYCGDSKLITSGVLMHTGVGMLPVKGNVANITISMPRTKLDEFIEKYTTKVCLCTTSDPIPAHILALAAKGMAPVDGIHAYYVINWPKFLELFKHERGSNTTMYLAGGYTVMISNYERVVPRNVSLNAHSTKASTSIGLIKTALY